MRVRGGVAQLAGAAAQAAQGASEDRHELHLLFAVADLIFVENERLRHHVVCHIILSALVGGQRAHEMHAQRQQLVYRCQCVCGVHDEPVSK